MLNVLSGVTGLADRAGRPEATAALYAGLQAARAEYGLPGSANERYAEGRMAQHIQRRPGHQDVHHVRRPDIEATVDLALDTLDDIAADERARRPASARRGRLLALAVAVDPRLEGSYGVAKRR